MSCSYGFDVSVGRLWGRRHLDVEEVLDPNTYASDRFANLVKRKSTSVTARLPSNNTATPAASAT
jgi:hypothetical protein